MFFVLDRSETIEDAQVWIDTIHYVQDVLIPYDVTDYGHPGVAHPNHSNNEFDSHHARSKVGVVTFADTQDYDFPFGDIDLSSLGLSDLFNTNRQIGLSNKTLGGLTFVDDALQFVYDHVAVDARAREDMVHRVVVVLTDGNPTPGHGGGAVARRLREDHHVSIVAIGVGNSINDAELARISHSTPGHRLRSMNPQYVYTDLNVSAPGPYTQDLRETLCVTCDADVIDNCNPSHCADAVTNVRCAATCCGICLLYTSPSPRD